MKNRYHQEILQQIQSEVKDKKVTSETSNYLCHTHFQYGLTVPKRREIAKNWAKKHKTITIEEFTSLLNSLYKGKSYEEKTIAGNLLEYLPKLRKQLAPILLDDWLSYLEGWAEIDTTCQSVFSAEELLSRWNEWRTLIVKLSKKENINKRRASLVLLTGTVVHSNDPRLSTLAFETIDRLKTEKSILITKAISWLLRDLTKNHQALVVKYLEKNKATLPKIAIRETMSKIQTGKK